jgi:hypothetical protein
MIDATTTRPTLIHEARPSAAGRAFWVPPVNRANDDEMIEDLGMVHASAAAESRWAVESLTASSSQLRVISRCATRRCRSTSVRGPARRTTALTTKKSAATVVTRRKGIAIIPATRRVRAAQA